MLSRKLVELGIYPAIDPLDSTSRVLDAQYVERSTTGVATETQQILQRYKDLQDIIAHSGHRRVGEEDKLVVSRARRIERFLSQPFYVGRTVHGHSRHMGSI